MHIRRFDPADEAAVIALWHACGLTRPWNDPHADIERKLATQPELFLVAAVDGEVVASVMVGFDGHRGWAYYLAVAAAHRGRSMGRALMEAAERLLVERGCPKLNLLVRSSNAEVVSFYEALGYVRDEVVSLGKRLIHDEPVATASDREPLADGGDGQPARPGGAPASPVEGDTPELPRIEVRSIRNDEIEAARLLLAANRWGPRVQDPTVFRALVGRSQIALVAVLDGRVVGFLRALTDGLFNGYISMVVVDEAHRSRGIGKALVAAAMGTDERMTWVLRAGRTGVSGFYEKLGYRLSEVAMERPGKR